MEKIRFSLTYLGEGRERTTVVYASSQAEAEQAFTRVFHPSKRLILATSDIRPRRSLGVGSI